MKKNIIIGTLGVLALSAVAVTTAFAYQGDSLKKGPNHTEEREVAMTKAITTGDYEAWKNLMTPGCKATATVTKEKFPRFAEMWKLEHSGNSVEAKKIRAELGLGQGMMKGNGKQGRMGNGSGQHRNISK